MADPTDLHALAVEFLSACSDALDLVPVADPTLEGAPTRQYVAPAQTADDCEQLIVFVSSVAEAPTDPQGLAAGRRAGRGFWINHVGLTARIVRCCFPTGSSMKAPTPTEWQAVAEQTDADAWALWNHLHNLIMAGELIPSCSETFFDSMQQIPISGGCGGWIVRVRAQLDGFGEAIVI